MAGAPIDRVAATIAVYGEPMPEGGVHPWHAHDQHELVWSYAGSYRLDVAGRSWLVSGGAAVWIPAGLTHRISTSNEFTCGWALLPTSRCPTLWAQQPTSVALTPLLKLLLTHLAQPQDIEERHHAEEVVLARLRPQLSSPTIELPLPSDERCRRIATAVLDDPGREWDLVDWGNEIGASARTLARVFRDEVGMPFGQWRTNARIRAAIAELSEGRPVGVVARRVGYSTASAFINAFRRTTGRTPTSYYPPEDPAVADDRSHLTLVG